MKDEQLALSQPTMQIVTRRLTGDQRQLVDLLRTGDGPLWVGKVAKLYGITPVAAEKRLVRLAARRIARRVSTGYYVPINPSERVKRT